MWTTIAANNYNMDISIGDITKDRQFVDSTNLISVKGNNIAVLNIDNNNVYSITKVSDIIGRLLGLNNNERDIFNKLNNILFILNHDDIDKTYFLKYATKFTGWSYRNINRMINNLIDSRIVLYNANTNAITINPKYIIPKEYNNVNMIAINYCNTTY